MYSFIPEEISHWRLLAQPWHTHNMFLKTETRKWRSSMIIRWQTQCRFFVFLPLRASSRGLNTCTCPADGDLSKAHCTKLKCPKASDEFSSWEVALWTVATAEFLRSIRWSKVFQVELAVRTEHVENGTCCPGYAFKSGDGWASKFANRILKISGTFAFAFAFFGDRNLAIWQVATTAVAVPQGWRMNLLAPWWPVRLRCCPEPWLSRAW